jgi:hypothetical protein
MMLIDRQNAFPLLDLGRVTRLFHLLATPHIQTIALRPVPFARTGLTWSATGSDDG